MRRAWRALRSCVASPADVWLLARLAAWAPALPLLKRVVPFRRLVRFMAAKPAKHARDPELERRIVRMARLVYRGRTGTFRDNCLERSLVVYRYLGRAGARPELRAGFRREGEKVRGHVWVLLDGRPVHEAPEELAGYGEVTAFGPDGARVSAEGAPSSPPGADGRPEAGHEPERPPGVGHR